MRGQLEGLRTFEGENSGRVLLEEVNAAMRLDVERLGL